MAYYSRRLAQIVYTLLVHIDSTKEIRGQLYNCSHNNETLSVLGDGNCMYRALSRGLFGTENYHLHVRLLTALEIIQNPKFYDISGKEFVDLVYDSRVFHDGYDNIVKYTTESCQYSEMLHIYAASAALSALTHTASHNHGDDPRPFLRHNSGQNARDHVIVFATDESLACCTITTWLYMTIW